MLWVTLMVLPQSSVTLYVLVIVSGHDALSDTSDTNATVGTEQLSASSVTTLILGVGTSPIHCTVIDAGLEAVGAISSLIIMLWVTLMVLPQSSVTL